MPSPRGAEATVKKNLSRNLDLFAKNGENGGTGQIPLILATTVKPALEDVESLYGSFDSTRVKLSIALLNMFRRFDRQHLTHLGLPLTPLTWRFAWWCVENPGSTPPHRGTREPHNTQRRRAGKRMGSD